MSVQAATSLPAPAARPAAIAFGIALAAAVVGIVLPLLVASPVTLSLATQGLTNAILATSVGFLIRQSGFVSFGHATFFGMGAYVTGLLLKHTGLALEAILPLAIALPAALAFVVGLVVVRVSGVAFSMLTLAVAQVFYEIVVKWRDFAGGDDGLSVTLPPRVFGLPTTLFQEPGDMFRIVWVTLVVILFLLFLLARSRFGRLCFAIKDNEERARFIGYRTLMPRALVFAISAAIGSIGGVLFVLYNGFVSPDVLHWTMSGSALVMAIIGGAEFLIGPAIGAVVFLAAKDKLGDITEHWQAIIGFTLILVTVRWPHGLVGTIWHWIRRRGRGGRA
ncbi:MAG: branched-chain amino acid ABC transporter permease [Alphaproteobacteria bacterium]|jgi:branched-chain amino acid transport system permease protein|nr:branched-chain amino acid ABC transporter permease [Alphaproteobacteria bacterium]